ncbi:TrmH family RNA methyltransferase [Phreatobacter sp.]|uniref:TrmH family RNA methyltransferase n=1 Tax=Phreatobacter sp. TaxID=1966341 RepID=UPI003F6F7858
MPGIDITRLARAHGSPAVILVQPQMAENIGTTARAMANFGLSGLRLVAPRDGWPNPKAFPAASGANRILEEAQLFATLEEAIADLTLTYAATARAHDQIKPVAGPREAVAAMAERTAAGETVGVIFGRERNGLLTEEVSLASAILTYPVNPDFSSLNLAQAVLVLGYEWFSQVHGAPLPFQAMERSARANRAQLAAFFAMLERELDKVEFFRPAEKRDSMIVNLRNIIQRMDPSRQDLATLHGAIVAIVEGSAGPSRSAAMGPEGAKVLRAFLAETTAVDGGTAPVRGFARLLRRNPTEAEMTVWKRLVRDRRFAGLGFKRAVPIGPHVADMVSFPTRVVVDFAPPGEDEAAAGLRAERLAWFEERGYRVVRLEAGVVAQDVEAALATIAAGLPAG